jgi:hypothetical protein
MTIRKRKNFRWFFTKPPKVKIWFKFNKEAMPCQTDLSFIAYPVICIMYFLR